MTRIVIFWVCLSAIYGCSSVKSLAIKRDINKILESSPIFSQYFVGFSLYDISSNQFISNYNSDRYFTPASNTKILTLGASLALGLDSVASFQIAEDDGEMFLRPLGDPTFLHPDFEKQPALDLLASLQKDTIYIDEGIMPELSSFGPGWAWDDYMYDFQPERSKFPVYGNIIRIQTRNGNADIRPDFFTDYMDLSAKRNSRSREFNMFGITIPPDLDSSKIEIPFVTSDELLDLLLTDTLNTTILRKSAPENLTWSTVYNTRSLDVVALMMQRSDNFISEQLIYNLMATHQFETQDRLHSELKNDFFKELEKPFIWVDGSGLSRYNMFTPESLTLLLKRIHTELTWEEIQYVFPNGGFSGTIKNWYGDEEPYVFAKTGTLRHNHCLSGYLVTSSGKRLIFSIMNNHFPFESNKVKEEMQKLLQAIRDNY